MSYSNLVLKKQKELFYKFYQESTRNELSQIKLNLLKKSKSRVEYYWKIMEQSNILKISIKKLLPKNKYRTFYRTKKRVLNAFSNIKPNFESILLKSTRPYHFREFYKQEDIDNMCNAYFNKDNLHNKSSLWVILKNTKYQSLSIKTFIKYIKNDVRNGWSLPKLPKIKHPRREYDIELGNLQMDVKILDNKENPLQTNIYLLDFIDEQSKFAFSKVISHQSPDEILLVVKKAIRYFKNHGILVRRIRTDNFMAFKKTNFVRTGLFNKFLNSKNIIHEFTPLGEPQCNGTIERFHKTISDEFCQFIKNEKDIDLIKNKLSIWIQHYNFKRYHYYQTIKEQEYSKRFMIPKNMINLILKQEI